MMDITDLNRGESARIITVEAPAPLKERLRALDLRAGKEITLLKVSFFKKSYLVRAAGLVALRREVAVCVKIARS